VPPKPEGGGEPLTPGRIPVRRPARIAVPSVWIAPELDEDVDPTRIQLGAEEPTDRHSIPILADSEAIADEPTRPSPLILVAAAGQTDRGLVRARNEDSFLMLEEHSLYAVADGMGGYEGGELASRLAVETLGRDFRSGVFLGAQKDAIPRGASELGRSIQRANGVIREKAQEDRLLASMGTTLVAARFMLNKQRLYVGHVGDSRCYRLRRGMLRQLTTDHTMATLGVKGASSTHLSRALGPQPTVVVDLIIAKPMPGDLYLLCSDGLTKMVPGEDLEELLASASDPGNVVQQLVERANRAGGKDNVTVVVIKVQHALWTRDAANDVSEATG
jgi:protein phosphatase